MMFDKMRTRNLKARTINSRNAGVFNTYPIQHFFTTFL